MAVVGLLWAAPVLFRRVERSGTWGRFFVVFGVAGWIGVGAMGRFYRRNLPHYQPDGAILFVTFRLLGSLPAEVMEGIRLRQLEIEELARSGVLLDEQVLIEQKRLFGVYDRALDAAARDEGGDAWLFREAAFARVMVERILAGEELGRFILHRFCVMPNHVHLLLEPLPMVPRELWPAGVRPEARCPGVGVELLEMWRNGQWVIDRDGKDAAWNAAVRGGVEIDGEEEGLRFWGLSGIMNGMKAAAAREINELRGTRGGLFLRESFDHYVRDAEEYGRILAYIDENPVKAGLCGRAEDWLWGSVGWQG